MTGPSDRELRARFEALRDADERDAPGFRAVLERAALAFNRDSQRVARRRLGVALAIAASLVIAAGISREWRRRDFVAQPLSSWTSPTAILLKTPGSELLAAPALLPSTLDHLTSTFAQREGR